MILSSRFVNDRKGEKPVTVDKAYGEDYNFLNPI